MHCANHDSEIACDGVIIILHLFKGPVVPPALYQMDGEVTLVPLLGAQ